MTAPAIPGPGSGRPFGADEPERSLERLAAGWRAFTTAIRLGWATEANWTDPVLFLIYSVAKPVSAALILVAMLEVIGGASTREYRAYVVTGSALWAFVAAGVGGLAWTILDDRERYRMLKYVYVSEASFLVVLVGRAVARSLVGTMGMLITFGVGIVVLGVPFDPLVVDWPALVVATALGWAAIVAIGILVAAIVMQTRQESWTYPEAVTGALFLLTGAVFPLAVLPAAVQVAGLVIPLTWWIEATRRALFPEGTSAFAGEGSIWVGWMGAIPSMGTILVVLLATGAVATLAAGLAFVASERRAKDRGLLDLTTGS